MSQHERTAMLLGVDGVKILASSWVAVFGVGGVGSFTVEALARAGIGRFSLFDDDVVAVSNINRQLIATHATVGRKKVDVMKERILDINPDALVNVVADFYTAENASQYPLDQYSYVVDAIDTVSSKLTLIEQATLANVPVISCMGAGNKLDPTRFEVSDISKTSVCPLAKVMRRELKQRGIHHLKVVYSKEVALKPMLVDQKTEDMLLTRSIDHVDVAAISAPVRTGKPKRQTPGSVSFVPSVAGLIIAGEVIKDLVSEINSIIHTKKVP